MNYKYDYDTYLNFVKTLNRKKERQLMDIIGNIIIDKKINL